MAAIWDATLVASGKASCFSSHITYLAGYIGFGIDAFTDLACSAIPIFIINRLQMSPRTKTALCMLMGLGSLTAACAIAKAVTLQGVFAQDYTFALTKPAVCTILEHLCGIILASIPALRPLFGHILDASRGRISRRSRSTGTPRSSRKAARWHTPSDPNRVSIAGIRSPAHAKENPCTIDSEDTMVVASPDMGTYGHHCQECGEKGIGRPGEITKTVSWRMSEHYSETERGAVDGDIWPHCGFSGETVDFNGVAEGSRDEMANGEGRGRFGNTV